MKKLARSLMLAALATSALPAAVNAEPILLDRSYIVMNLTQDEVIAESPTDQCHNVVVAYYDLLNKTIGEFRQLGWIATVHASPQQALPQMERDLRLFGHPEVASVLNVQLTALDHKSMMVCPKA